LAALIETLAEVTALHRAGRLDEAATAFADLLAQGCAAEALQGLGLVKFQQGEAACALPLLEAAEALAPTARGAFNLAIVLAALGRTGDAVAAHRRNIEAHPDYPGSYTTLAALLASSGEAVEAAAVLAKLVELALKASATTVLDEAAGQLLRLEADPPNLTLLANTLRMGGRQDLSTAMLERRLERVPGDVAARLALAMARLATIHGSEAEITERRAAYAADVAVLEAVLDRAAPEALREAASEVGNAKPFLLAYQGQDDTALQAAYGRIASRLSAARAPSTPLLPASSGRLRIGFATAYFHQHSISKLFGGWIRQLDRSRFEVFGYHLGDDHDAMSAELGGACDVYRHGAAGQDTWARTIVEDGLHALIYPEIGMHPLPVQLACRRLAPVQAMAWGHPVTSGLPQIDYFLTSDLMEPADGKRHYVEKLVRLPNLSIWYPPLPSEGGRLSRAGLGLTEDAMVYVCCQSLFKYLPRYDHVFADIAKRAPNARFLFLKDGRPAVTDAFRSRMSAAFASAGLSVDDHVVMAAQVPYEDFPSLLRAGDLYLDSIGWSGGNTTLEALTCDLPAITWPVGLMRGRHTAAMLTRIGLDGCIADSAESYVDLAVRFADPERRAALRAEVSSRKAMLFHDLEPVRALEDFLAHVIAERLTEAAA
jgi:protein O-GlcNAc transferase